MDKLDTIFEEQRKFEEKLGYNFDDMSLEERVAYIKEYVLHCEHELHEMLQELPYFKPWKQYDENIGFANASAEFADALHFFINVAIALGFSAESLAAAYKNKLSINHMRQTQQEYKPCVEVTDEATRS